MFNKRGWPVWLLIDFRKKKTNILRSGFKGCCGGSVPTSKTPWEKRIKWNGTTWTKFLSSRVHLWCCLSCGNKQCVNFLLIQHHLAVAIETTSNVGKVKNAVDRLGGLVLVSKLPERRHTKEMGWISSRYWSNLCQENRIQSVTSLGTKGGDGRNWIVPKECVMHKNAWRPIFCKFKIKSFLLSFWNCWYFIRHDIIGSGVAQSSPMFCGWKENTSTRLFTSELRIGSWYPSRESRWTGQKETAKNVSAWIFYSERSQCRKFGWRSKRVLEKPSDCKIWNWITQLHHYWALISKEY